jgi:hypothetical protein
MYVPSTTLTFSFLELPHDSALCLLGIYLKESKSAYYRETHMFMFIVAQFIIKIMESVWMPINGWIKIYGIYTQWNLSWHLED